MTKHDHDALRAGLANWLHDTLFPEQINMFDALSGLPPSRSDVTDRLGRLDSNLTSHDLQDIIDEKRELSLVEFIDLARALHPLGNPILAMQETCKEMKRAVRHLMSE